MKSLCTMTPSVAILVFTFFHPFPGALAAPSSPNAVASATKPLAHLGEATPSPTRVVYGRADAQVTNNPGIYTLLQNFTITNATTTRTYDWTISQATGAPDGYSREMLVINGQYPGPLIEANEGDTIIVNVQNNMVNGTAIHWHGMLQNGTGWADGVPGITQCPIPSGGSFQYQFTLTGQYGTYWYHSHMGNTMADGILGPLVVHSPNDPSTVGTDYTEERVVMVGDWSQHDLSDVIVSDLLSVQGYQGSAAAPVPNALLINGVGVYNCSSVTDGTACTTQTIPEVQVLPDTKYRLRIINHASHVHYKFSIDEHALQVIAADGTPLSGPSDLHQLPIGIGQRYDVIIDTSAGSVGDAYYIRSAMCSASIANVPSDFDITALAVLRYVSSNSTATTTTPTSSDWSDSVNNESTCYDLDTVTALVPSVAIDAPSSALASTVLSSAFGFITTASSDLIGAFFFNSVSWTNYIYNPLLPQVQAGGTLNSSIITNALFPDIGGADIIINNRDGVIDHPYHLHGNPFFVIARGSGVMTAELYAALDSSALNLTNPLRRDTIVVQRNDYAILRIMTDNPGVFPLHCHIGWHLAEGKMAAIVVQPTAIQAETAPDAWTALCDSSNFASGDTVDTVAPGRKRTSPRGMHRQKSARIRAAAHGIRVGK